MPEGFGFLIAAVVIVCTFVSLLWYDDYQSKKEKSKETKIRLNDSLLQRYYAEMNNDRNDGWTKQHYKTLYYNRLNRLKQNK